jgi:hypothetical protein
LICFYFIYVSHCLCVESFENWVATYTWGLFFPFSHGFSINTLNNMIKESLIAKFS